MVSISEAITAANDHGRLALAAFLTAGFPDKRRFCDVASAIAAQVDVLEIGVPFSDPMADGVSIQHASAVALRNGVTLSWILESVASIKTPVPVILMSYLNPLLAYGLQDLPRAAARAGVSGFIVPDLPYEEAPPVRDQLRGEGIDLIQLVTPATPDDRLAMVCDDSRGFVYAVTMTGTTGGDISHSHEVATYLDRVCRASPHPVMAGFGIRKPEHIPPFAGHAHGVIVGSALVEGLQRGEDPLPFISALQKATYVGNEVMP